MLLRDVDVGAIDPAFQHRPKAFNRVGMGVATDILVSRVIDAFMRVAVNV